MIVQTIRDFQQNILFCFSKFLSTIKKIPRNMLWFMQNFGKISNTYAFFFHFGRLCGKVCKNAMLWNDTRGPKDYVTLSFHFATINSIVFFYNCISLLASPAKKFGDLLSILLSFDNLIMTKNCKVSIEFCCSCCLMSQLTSWTPLIFL